jgi:EAL domain-containing protein (putative c-di-GMP-specific phosphodiesterase class I)
LDDFGTGFSSLSLLREFPANVVKIDSSFVATMSVNAEDRSIVKSMVKLGHNLDRSVVAEGVEDLNSLNYLKQFGCDFMQGRLLAKPMSCSDTLSWLDAYLLKSKEELGRLNNIN